MSQCRRITQEYTRCLQPSRSGDCGRHPARDAAPVAAIPVAVADTDPFGVGAWRHGIAQAEQVDYTSESLTEDEIATARAAAIADVVAVDLPTNGQADPAVVAAHQAELDRIADTARHLAALPQLAPGGPLADYGQLLRERYGPRPPSADEIPDPSDDDLPPAHDHTQAASNDRVMVNRWARVRWERDNAGTWQHEWDDHNQADPAHHIPLIASDGTLHAVGCDEIGLDANPAGTLLEHAGGRIHLGCVGPVRARAQMHHDKLRWARQTLRHLRILLAPGPPGTDALKEAAVPSNGMFRMALARKATETIGRTDAEWVAGVTLDLDRIARDDNTDPWEADIAAAMRDRIVGSLDADPGRLVDHAIGQVGPPPAGLAERMRRRVRGYDPRPAVRDVLDRVAAAQPDGPPSPAPDRWSDRYVRLAGMNPNLWLLASVAHDRGVDLAQLAERLKRDASS